MFKKTKPKQFNLKTRYWNPEEEERERRKKRAERKKEDYVFDKKEFKEEMSYRWGMNRTSNSSFNQRYTSINRMLLFALIAAVIIIILVYVKVF